MEGQRREEKGTKTEIEIKQWFRNWRLNKICLCSLHLTINVIKYHNQNILKAKRTINLKFKENEKQEPKRLNISAEFIYKKELQSIIILICIAQKATVNDFEKYYCIEILSVWRDSFVESCLNDAQCM